MRTRLPHSLGICVTKFRESGRRIDMSTSIIATCPIPSGCSSDREPLLLAAQARWHLSSGRRGKHTPGCTSSTLSEPAAVEVRSEQLGALPVRDVSLSFVGQCSPSPSGPAPYTGSHQSRRFRPNICARFEDGPTLYFVYRDPDASQASAIACAAR